jgi:hypothetical protein
MAEGRTNAGSNCLEDITSASWQDGVQGLSYVPSLKDDENMKIGDEEVEILFRSSTNKPVKKPVKKPYVKRVPSLGAKVSSFFKNIILVACTFIFLLLGFKLQL